MSDHDGPYDVTTIFEEVYNPGKRQQDEIEDRQDEMEAHLELFDAFAERATKAFVVLALAVGVQFCLIVALLIEVVE